MGKNEDHHDDSERSDPAGRTPGHSDGDEPELSEIARTEQTSFEPQLHSSGVANGWPTSGLLDEVSAEPVTQEQLVEFRRELFAGPLPHPETLAAYKEIDPAYPGAILKMAQDSLAAQIENDRAPITAEAFALRVATFAASFLPWLLIVLAGILAFAGRDVAAAISAVAGFTGGGVQIVNAVRKPKTSPDTQKSS